MHSNAEVARVAVVSDGTHPSGSQRRFLGALSQSPQPGFQIDLPGDGVPVGARTDRLHLLGGHERLTVSGLGAVRGRTWQRSLTGLTSAWTAALVPTQSPIMRAA